jgi:hypothetical protein
MLKSPVAASLFAYAFGTLLVGTANAAQQEPVPPPATTETPPPPPAAAETPPPVVVIPSPSTPPLPPVALSVPAATPATTDPLAGVSDQTAFLRSPDNEFILFPNGRLHLDGYFFKTGGPKPPNDTFLVRRARAELAGWIGKWFYFAIGGDFASGPPAAANPIATATIAATDDFIAICPWGDWAMLQFGQYDAPFTLENRTSDKYFDFMERSVTVRAFGIPSNKEVGWMLHGINPDKNFYYSLAVINGDGQNFRNADNKFDFMGRAWVAPLSFAGPEFLRAITVGGSLWEGDRTNALPIASQTTQAGYTFLSTRWNNAAMGTTAASTYELHQDRRLQAVAAEVNAPVAHKVGVRWELVWKRQPFTVNDVTGGRAPTPLGDGGKLQGWSTYGEAWYWVMGDDRIVGDPGLQLPTRFKKFGVKPPQPGLMLVARLNYLDETVTNYAGTSALAGSANVAGQTKVTTLELGANYWHSRRFRATFNYVFNHFGGDNVNVMKLRNEHEFLFRLAIAL